MIFDVVIIGSGLAGLSSALQAAKHGKVLIATKSTLMESNSSLAQGGIAGVFEPEDNFKKHIQDTLTAGANHNNKKAVKYFVEQSPTVIKILQKLGTPFETDKKGQFVLNREAGHGFRRIVHVGDHTGLSIMQAVVKKVVQHRNITVWQNSFAKELIVKNKTCWGMTIIRNSKNVNVYARRTILATGGAGQLYQYTTNPPVTTGDGIALASRAGARIQDMEFIQFHPTALAYGKSPLFLLSETLRGEGAKLMNAKGEKFMTKYHKLAELAPRDIVSRAIFRELQKGPVFLDIHHTPANELKKKFPTIYSHLLKTGYDLSKGPVPITPAAHYLCGGIATNVFGKTKITNLYAVGEAACTGLHGANRLASDSLLEAAVMGEHVMDSPLPPAKSFENFLKKITENPGKGHRVPRGEKKLIHIKSQLQKNMWKNVGIVRTKKLLNKANKDLQTIKNKLKKYPESILKLELQNMLEVSQLITKAALKRRKSLGAHCRND